MMRFIILCFLMVFMAGPVMAATTDPLAALTAQEKLLTKNATDAAKDQFDKIKTAHGTIRAVRHVRTALDRAIKSCATHNPTMKKDLEKSFQDWRNSVMPVIRQAQNKLDKMVLTQTVGKPEQIRAYLAEFDRLVKAEDAKVKEVPVKDAVACDAMMKNLGQSQKIMAGLLRETLGLPAKN